MLPVLSTIYDNLSTPEKISLPGFVQGSDLMDFKQMLSTVRKLTSSTNTHLVALEAELIEQSAERGDLDAITLLAFETLGKTDKTKEDTQHANKLIGELVELDHPLVFKMAGDLAWSKNAHAQAVEYWKKFIALEPASALASQVYFNLGYYYFTYLVRPDVVLSKLYFEKSVNVGDVSNDEYAVKSHYYLGQLYVENNPKVSRYHWEISSSKGLKESYSSLGFLEMNVFNNYEQAAEWFKLGAELSNDMTCNIGMFDCYRMLKSWKLANVALNKIYDVRDKIAKLKFRKDIPENIQASIKYNQSLLKAFFDTRKDDIILVQSRIV
ncbi:Protein MSS2, mitochondrial [Candida viswanathii]|uniref:Protein MSS2, mitochondrial n=1 Tax=Candida viswanathii TaxID=5486 RepID=A0A367YH31_9ASCO|nr:Protein MSS2, mitochondrial [Candida viswanathii]